MNKITFEQKELYPSKVICIGRNYVEHISELGNEMPSQAVIFVKPNSAISEDLYSHSTDEIHYEAEICLLIENNQYTGIGLGLDLTKRKVQNVLKEKGLPWERAKSFDCSAVFTSFVSIPKNICEVSLTLKINDEVRQQGGYSLMLFKPNEILQDIHEFMSTENGDIVMTGTPKGVGVVKLGDKFNLSLYDQQQLILEKEWIVREA